MPIQYHYDPSLKVIFAKGIGVVSLTDLLEYGMQVLKTKEDLSGAVEYVDLSEAIDIAVSYNSASNMIEIYKQWISRGVKGSVLYAPSDFCYAMARMIGAVISSVMGKPDRGPLVVRTPVSPETLASLFPDNRLK
jgi:hypothetical protein